MSATGHATGMAGEFHAMEILHRKGHQPTLTLGNAKTIDIFTRSPSGNRYEVSVKAIRGGGKFGIGNEDYAKPEHQNLVFMLFLYKNFDDVKEHPVTWIIPASEVEKIKRPWHTQYGLYLYKEFEHLLKPYKDAWQYLD